MNHQGTVCAYIRLAASGPTWSNGLIFASSSDLGESIRVAIFGLASAARRLKVVAFSVGRIGHTQISNGHRLEKEEEFSTYATHCVLYELRTGTYASTVKVKRSRFFSSTTRHDGRKSTDGGQSECTHCFPLDCKLCELLSF